jgi:hypothetical protein
MKRHLLTGAILIAVIGALGIGSVVLEKKSVVQAAAVQAPRFEVDPMWPKPLPNHWIMGNTISVSVDSKDHVWIIHRGGSLEAKEVYATTTPPGSECCVPAPPVLEFDQEGNLLAHWGGEDGPGYVWPASNHGITVDFKRNVWIGGNARAGVAAGPEEAANAPAANQAKQAAAKGKAPAGRGGPPNYHDSMVLKFTQEGSFHGYREVGTSGEATISRISDCSRPWLTPRPTNHTSPMIQQARNRSTPTPANTSATGEPAGTSRTTPIWVSRMLL